MELVSALANLGLTEKEAKVYLALLQLGKTTAYAVSLRSNLKKPTTYVILDNLIKKGAVQKIPRAGKAFYIATDPEEFLSMVQKRFDGAKAVLPELKSLNKKSTIKKIGALYYEGISGIREMYNKILKESRDEEFLGFFAHAEDTPPELNKYFDELNEQIKKIGIKRRGVTVAHPTILKNKYFDKKWAKEHFAHIKALDSSKYNSNISIEIFKDKIIVFSHRYLQATVIENPDVADVMRQVFELVWERKDIVKVETGA